MKSKVYKKKPGFGAVVAAILRTAVVLIILGIVLFFLLRSWTVYDEAGAHIRFPWSQAAE
ncbi:MAG: hypothetical protein J5633_02480 [Oscillospiraceae bacterium]|nr:hypothetical protein [Oscillospiraceae bacterium]